MPIDFINKRVEQLEVGQKGYVFQEAIGIDLNHYVWLNPEHPVQDDSESIFKKILVIREELGWSITLPKMFDGKWTPKNSSETYADWEYEPVMKVIMGEE